MSKDSVKLVGMNKLVAKLEYCCSDRSAVRAVVLKNGNQMNAQMKDNMEKTYVAVYKTGKKKGQPIHTGDTAGSVNTVLTDHGMTANVGPTMEYDQYVEYGTRFMKAEPTIRPAFEKQVPIFIRDMKAICK